jgi:DNA polymerase-1
MKILIVDVSYLMFKSYFGYPNLTFGDKPVGAFFGFSQAILQMQLEIKPDLLVLAKDLPTPTWRHKENSQYKAGRSPMEETMRVQLPQILQWCQELCPNSIAVDGYEADDIIWTVGSKYLRELENFKEQKTDVLKTDFDSSLQAKQELQNQEKNQVFVFSADRDLYQLFVYPGVKFVKTEKGNFSYFDKQLFLEKYQINPFQWVDYKTLLGDSSDNLAGVKGIGPKTATKILAEIGCLANFYNSVGFDASFFEKSLCVSANLDSFFENPKNQKWIQALCENYETVKSTYKLATLSIVPNIQISENKNDWQAAKKLLLETGFKSLTKYIDKIEPVKQEVGLF